MDLVVSEFTHYTNRELIAMFKKIACFSLSLLIFGSVCAAAEKGKKVPAALKFKMDSLDGKKVDMAKYQGKVVLVVNVASECGLTPQYEQLQALHEKFSKEGLAVLGFPCNQFGSQEPGSAADINTFCKKNYGVEFDMFSKVDVNGKDACEFYQHLTSAETKPKGSGKVGWNFEKFLINRQGEVIGRYNPQTAPDDPALLKTISTELEK